MAGYIGSKAVNLSTTGADITGDADVSGALDVGGAFTSQGIDDNANATAITIDSSENVGIGTSLPSDVLHVVTPTFGGMTLECTGATADPTFKFLGDSGNYWSLQQDASQGDSFQFRYNNSEKVRIDSAGRVTTPNQPAFRAYKSNGTVHSNNVIVLFNDVDLNIGSAYSSSTGRFTAPGAGNYMFNVQGICGILEGTHVHGELQLRQNGVLLHRGHYNHDNRWENVSYSTVVNMAVNDYVEVKFVQGIGSPSLYGYDKYTSFSGYSLG